MRIIIKGWGMHNFQKHLILLNALKKAIVKNCVRYAWLKVNGEQGHCQKLQAIIILLCTTFYKLKELTHTVNIYTYEYIGAFYFLPKTTKMVVSDCVVINKVIAGKFLGSDIPFIRQTAKEVEKGVKILEEGYKQL